MLKRHQMMRELNGRLYLNVSTEFLTGQNFSVKFRETPANGHMWICLEKFGLAYLRAT